MSHTKSGAASSSANPCVETKCCQARLTTSTFSCDNALLLPPHGLEGFLGRGVNLRANDLALSHGHDARDPFLTERHAARLALKAGRCYSQDAIRVDLGHLLHPRLPIASVLSAQQPVAVAARPTVAPTLKGTSERNELMVGVV